MRQCATYSRTIIKSCHIYYSVHTIQSQWLFTEYKSQKKGKVRRRFTDFEYLAYIESGLLDKQNSVPLCSVHMSILYRVHTRSLCVMCAVGTRGSLFPNVHLQSSLFSSPSTSYVCQELYTVVRACAVQDAVRGVNHASYRLNQHTLR